MRTKLSVNINKVATIRNARGGNNPDIISYKAESDPQAWRQMCGSQAEGLGKGRIGSWD